MDKITVVFPGGFKPLTGAHLELANRYAQAADVEKVILLIGEKPREEITREKTIEIFMIVEIFQIHQLQQKQEEQVIKFIDVLKKIILGQVDLQILSLMKLLQ